MPMFEFQALAGRCRLHGVAVLRLHVREALLGRQSRGLWQIREPLPSVARQRLGAEDDRRTRVRSVERHPSAHGALSGAAPGQLVVPLLGCLCLDYWGHDFAICGDDQCASKKSGDGLRPQGHDGRPMGRPRTWRRAERRELPALHHVLLTRTPGQVGTSNLRRRGVSGLCWHHGLQPLGRHFAHCPGRRGAAECFWAPQGLVKLGWRDGGRD
mmetsp:Transcript_122467/g.305810  ORF Transcript_122467/g.305810 Transcript_122467/m.305810 type:complete len:213 (-) Transcript_122467:224-862(-)